MGECFAVPNGTLPLVIAALVTGAPPFSVARSAMARSPEVKEYPLGNLGLRSQHLRFHSLNSADPFVDLLTETASRMRAKVSTLTLVKTVELRSSAASNV